MLARNGVWEKGVFELVCRGAAARPEVVLLFS